jgi:VanZ family protein
VLKGSLIVAVIVTLEEFSQLFLHNRGFSLVDLAADYVGIILFGQLAAYINAQHEPVTG